MKLNSPVDFDAAFKDNDLIDEAMRASVHEEMWRKKRLGQPIVEYRDGKIVWVPAEEIVIEEPHRAEQ